MLIIAARELEERGLAGEPLGLGRLDELVGHGPGNRFVVQPFIEESPDVAIESADITLLKGDLNGILKARNLSIETMKNIRQNLFFAFIYNVLGVPIAAGILYPSTGILLSPVIASAAMSFSSVSVVANALRLRRVKL